MEGSVTVHKLLRTTRSCCRVRPRRDLKTSARLGKHSTPCAPMIQARRFIMLNNFTATTRRRHVNNMRTTPRLTVSTTSEHPDGNLPGPAEAAAAGRRRHAHEPGRPRGEERVPRVRARARAESATCTSCPSSDAALRARRPDRVRCCGHRPLQRGFFRCGSSSSTVATCATCRAHSVPQLPSGRQTSRPARLRRRLRAGACSAGRGSHDNRFALTPRAMRKNALAAAAAARGRKVCEPGRCRGRLCLVDTSDSAVCAIWSPAAAAR